MKTDRSSPRVWVSGETRQTAQFTMWNGQKIAVGVAAGRHVSASSAVADGFSISRATSDGVSSVATTVAGSRVKR